MKGDLIFGAFMLVYVILTAIPGEWFWFDPTEPVIADSRVGEDPHVTYLRDIKAKAGIRYSVILRTGPEATAACIDAAGPFNYLPKRSGPLDMALTEWTTDPRCHDLPVGVYYGQVTWTIINPYRDLLPEWLRPILGGVASIIPPKEVERDIPIFNRLAKETP